MKLTLHNFSSLFSEPWRVLPSVSLHPDLLPRAAGRRRRRLLLVRSLLGPPGRQRRQRGRALRPVRASSADTLPSAHTDPLRRSAAALLPHAASASAGAVSGSAAVEPQSPAVLPSRQASDRGCGMVLVGGKVQKNFETILL